MRSIIVKRLRVPSYICDLIRVSLLALSSSPNGSSLLPIPLSTVISTNLLQARVKSGKGGLSELVVLSRVHLSFCSSFTAKMESACPNRNLWWNEREGGGGGGKSSPPVSGRGTLSDKPSDFHSPPVRLRVCVPLRLGVRSSVLSGVSG